MGTRKPLVCQHLENISGSALAEYQAIIREYVRGRQGVYALYKRDRLYYVGLATNLRNRLKQHLKDKHAGRWDSVVQSGCAEASMIRHQIACVLALILAVHLGGCTASVGSVGRVQSNYDKYKDTQVDMMTISPRGASLVRVQQGKSAPIYAFVMPNLLSGKGGPSRPTEMIFIADGERINLRGDAKLEDVSLSRHGVSYMETAYFPVSPDQIRMLSGARSLEYRLYMNNAEDPQGPIGDQTKQAMQQFCDQFVLGHKPAPAK